MSITAAPSNSSITHRDGIRCARDVYAASLAVSGAAEVGTFNSDGAAVFDSTVLVTGVATFTANPVFTGYPSIGGVSSFKPVRSYRGNGTPTSIATAGAGTITAAHVLTGTIVRDCAGGSRSDTLPAADALVAALAAAFGVAAAVGDSIDVLYINGSDPVSEIITLIEGVGGGWDTNQTAVSRTILGTCSKLLRLRITNVTALAEAYVVYT